MTETKRQNLADIIRKLSYPGDTLPEHALHDAIKYYDDIKAELHAALKLCPDAIMAMEAESEEDYMLQCCAMYLAAEKRDRDAFPLIRDFFVQYGEEAVEISGDIACEHLDQILASVCQDPEALKSAAELPGLSIWSRSAFFGALGILFHLGHLERAQLVDWFQTWLMQDELDIECRTSIAFICCDLGIHELDKILLEALKSGRIDPESMSPEYLSDAIRDEKIEAYKQCRYELVDDAAELLALWFQTNEPDLYEELYEPEEIDTIATLLNEHNKSHADTPLDLVFFHAYVQAVVLTPEPLSANEWIPEIFAGEMPAFDSIEEANATLGVLMQFYNRLNQLRLEHMLHCPFRLEDRHQEWWLNSVREWCRGFVLGMSLRRDYWTLPDAEPEAEDIHAAMMTLLAVADDAVVAEICGADGDGSRSKKGDEFLARAILTLPDAIRVLTEHTQSQDAMRVTNLPIHSTKVGRNASCPCGSGKKFKKCCGAPGRSVH